MPRTHTRRALLLATFIAGADHAAAQTPAPGSQAPIRLNNRAPIMTWSSERCTMQRLAYVDA